MDYIDAGIIAGCIIATFAFQYAIEKVSNRVKSRKRRNTWIPSN